MLDDLRREITAAKETLQRLENYLQITTKKERLAVLRKETEAASLWQDPQRAKAILQELKLTEKNVTSFGTLASRFEDLETLLQLATNENEEKDLRQEFSAMQSEIRHLELAALLSGPYDQNNAILSISAGAGGTDAQDWAQILLRMYTRYAETKSYTTEIADLSYGEEAGIKGVTVIISGPYAYGYLKHETGIHRLVRISPFSSEGKRHTSFVSVEVIPEITEDIKVDINPNDLRVDTYRASGPGGQNVNKVSSAIRITHVPTGLVVASQSQRSQHQNREYAMRILRAKLYELMLKEHKDKIEELKGEKKAIEWGHQIRSYVFQPYTLVKDHRTGAEVGDVQKVIDGGIDDFIEASLRGGQHG